MIMWLFSLKLRTKSHVSFINICYNQGKCRLKTVFFAGNLTRDRQTRMLADLNKFKCPKDGPSEVTKRRMLQSAKENLARLPMFGLNEHLFATQYLLKLLLNLEFKQFMVSRNSTHVSLNDISQSDLQAVKEVNRYDTELYKFAERLFLERLKYVVSFEKNSGRKMPQEVQLSLDILVEYTKQ